MYTFAPLENVNTVDIHFGFYLIAFFTACAWLYMMITCRDDLEGAGWVTVVMMLFVGVCAGVSWNTGEIKNYANTPVEAKFVAFAPEGYNETRHVGKTVKHVDVHEMYVVYRVAGENVIVRARDGVAYPETAILYKN